MAEPLDQRIAEAVRLINEVEDLVRQDRPRAALEQAEEALHASEGQADWLRAGALHARGRAHDALGDRDAAATDLAAAAELDPSNPARWMLLAQLAASQEDWEAARSLYSTAIEVAESVNDRTAIPQARWELGHLARVLGDLTVARRELTQSVAVAEELGDLEAAAFSELALAELEKAEGDGEKAREHYAHVRTMSDLLPGAGGRHVTAEPAAPAAQGMDLEARQLPAPPDADPVLRIVLAPRLGEHAELELWSGDGSEPLRCVVPFRFAVHPRTEDRLRWYIEDYASRAIDVTPAIAADTENDLRLLGEALFDTLLAQPESVPVAERLHALTDRLRVEVVADAPSADALPWELLRNPGSEADLALTTRSITRTTSAALTAHAAAAVRDDAAVRMLIVISRPEGRLDVGFRTVADPLLRELAASGASVEVDVLRPPTFERLGEVLRAAADASRPYDLVHFDGHGVFDAEEGGALVFESGDEAGTLVAGDVLGEELRGGAVPLLVMNACRSAAGHQEHAYGSVARESLECGLAAVVAMRFNVYVHTAAAFMAGLYRALGEGDDIQEAVTDARRRLTEYTDRGGLPVVSDWSVPVLYQAAPVRLAGAAATSTRPAPERDLSEPPAHGFVGRDEVFVELEAVLVRSPHVVLRSFAGAGKTTLATEFARWYVRTGGCGVAGPRVSLADTPSATELRGRLGSLGDRPLLIWDDARDLADEHMRLLEEIAAEGGRVLVICDRRLDLPRLPTVAMPSFPGDEAEALAIAVAADAGAQITPEAAGGIGRHLRGHALGIELAVRELARRDRRITGDSLEGLLSELRTPTNSSPAPWTRELGEQLEIEGTTRDTTLVAQFRGYVSVVGLGSLRGDDDFDAAEEILEAMAAKGLLSAIGPAVYSIHPGLPVALAATGRYEPPGRAFAEAVAETASGWATFAELGGGHAPWPAEAANIVTARRLASREGWWPVVVRLLEGLMALATHGGMPDVGREEIVAAARDFVDLDTGHPHPGMEEYADAFLGHLAWVAEMEGDHAKVTRLRTVDVAHRRAAAAEVLRIAPQRRAEEHEALIRRLAVGLTNLGLAQRDLRAPEALESMSEASELAGSIDDWRLEALNRLNLGVYWMTVPVPPEFDRADAEFDAGYKLAIQDDPSLAGMLMTERGTVHYERALASDDVSTRRAELERAAELLELAVGLREPDAVLFHQLGQVHRHLGHFEASRAWLEQTIELRDAEATPGAGADSRLHLALALEDAGLLDEALRFARSAEQVLAQAATPDAALQTRIEEAMARLTLMATVSGARSVT